MRIEFNPDIPIYVQLIQLIRQSILAGQWPLGEKVPSVRDLAIEYGVNPNTVQKALAELERDGLLFAERTAGRYVTSSAERINRLREDMAGQQIREFSQKMAAMGFSQEQLLNLLLEKWGKENGHH